MVMRNKRIKYLILFIAIVSIVSTSLFLYYYFQDNDNETEHVLIEFDNAQINKDEIIKLQDLEVYNFDTVYNDMYDVWYVKMYIKNNSGQEKEIDDMYLIKFFDENSNLINETEQRIFGNIEAYDKLMYAVILEFDGSNIKSISISKK